jgi:hypothetical protein
MNIVGIKFKPEKQLIQIQIEHLKIVHYESLSCL